MKIALIGYGKMGREVEKIAREKHELVIVDEKTPRSAWPELLKDAVCIDFTTPAAFLDNYQLIAELSSGAVVGTTGWLKAENEVRKAFLHYDHTLIYGGNFSLGANLFFQVVAYASQLFAKAQLFDPYLLEMHHRMKLDAPSGTAKILAQQVEQGFKKPITPVSVRAGWIRGVHEIGFESEADHVILRHEAYTRGGFAQGALLAAEWAVTVRGVWQFADLLQQKLQISVE